MPVVDGKEYPYTKEGIAKARKARERFLTSDGVLLGKMRDQRKRPRVGTITVNAGARDLIKNQRRTI